MSGACLTPLLVLRSVAAWLTDVFIISAFVSHVNHQIMLLRKALSGIGLRRYEARFHPKPIQRIGLGR